MTVYCIIDYDWVSSHICSIWSTREKAEAECERLKTKLPKYSFEASGISVDAYIVDEEQ